MSRLKVFWNLTKGNRTLYFCAIAFIGVSTLLSLLPPLVISFTFDSVLGNEPINVPAFMRWGIDAIGGLPWVVQNIWVCGVAIVSISIVSGVFAFFRGKWVAQASERISRKMRNDLYDHLQRMDYEYHVKAQTGDLIQRCTSDVDTIRRFLSSQMVEIGRAVFIVIIALPIMLRISVKMTLLSMFILPVILVFSYAFFNRVQRIFKEVDEQEGKLSAVLQENLTGVRVVRAFARQRFEVDKFEVENIKFKNLVVKLIHTMSLYWSLSDALSFSQMAVALVYGIYMTVTGEITVGNMIVFNSYVGMLLWPIRQLGRILTDLGKTFVSLNRVREILDAPVEDMTEDGLTPSLDGDIVFTNVCFSYDEKNPILDNISFTIKRGQTIAILGHTGSGKTSLMHILLRLYDYQSGSVTISGVELKKISKKWLRQQIGIVLQEPFLYSKTIKENILMASPNVTTDEVYKATRIASVHSVIEEFESGYDTSVGERGVTLSGGQKQRIAIARTLIKNSSVLIFDDSLSAVDTQTDAAIRSALNEESRNITTFIISHRITTLSEADNIFVIEHGKLTQMGNHEKLLNEDGLYARVWAIQNMLEEDLENQLEVN